MTGISLLPARFLENIALHGLVVSTGELRRVHENAFIGLIRPLQALGLPNNLLDSVPTAALSHLIGLEKLDLSQNKLKTLEADSFKVAILKLSPTHRLMILVIFFNGTMDADYNRTVYH